MGFQEIFNNEGGSSVRTKLNKMFAELFNSVASLFSSKADKSNVLELDNTDVYEPTLDYHPATKKSVSELQNWTETVDTLSPKLASVKTIKMQENGSGLTQLYIKNSNDADDYAGAVISLEGSGDEFTNFMSVGKYSSNFYIVSWAGNACMVSDKPIIVSSEKNVLIETGGTADVPKAVFDFEEDGTLVAKTANYENLVIDDNDIPNKKYVDNTIATSDLYYYDATVGIGGKYAEPHAAFIEGCFVLKQVGDVVITQNSTLGTNKYRIFQNDIRDFTIDFGVFGFMTTVPVTPLIVQN